METLPSDPSRIVVKQEPIDDLPSPSAEENNNTSSRSLSKKTKSFGGDTTKDNKSSPESDAPTTQSSQAGPLRYISRRGRPPGGGYSMKSAHSHYVSFGQSAVGMAGSHDFLRQSSLGTSAGSPQDLLKNGLDSSFDSLDVRRFGLHCFEGEKNAFRCDGCEVVFGSRDTYAMHMLLRAKNESCVALPTSSISANPENPTPREKFEREIREKAMISALRSQAALMSKAAVAAATIPRNNSVVDSAIQSLSSRSPNSPKEDLSSFGSSDISAGLNSLFSFDSYGLYMDQRQYRRLLSEYSFRAATSPSNITAMMEQLSCSVCGEVFTNKDALAMHMMFHTRDDEGETKPVISPSWKLDSSSTLSKMMPLSVSTSDINNMGSVPPRVKRQESSRSDGGGGAGGERQLTVERIEELKRMAIESSLKSSLRRYPNNGNNNNNNNNNNNRERNPRPKSVSEDTVVTSSAQTRPLSADDIFKRSHLVDKRLYKPHKMVFKPHQRDSDGVTGGDHADADKDATNHRATSDRTRDSIDTPRIPFRKRNLSISDDYLSGLSPFYKRPKHFYSDNDVRSIAFRYDSLKSSISSGDASLSLSKVCDNHVSSASGPQDSDDNTSNESSSSAALESTRVSFEKSNSRDVESTSPLDHIMSGDTILVPVENPEDLHVGAEQDEYSTGHHGATTPLGASAAIDFSVGKTSMSDTANVNRHEKMIASHAIQSGSRMFNKRKNSENSLSLSQDKLIDGENNDNAFPMRDGDLLESQHHVELVPDDTMTSSADAKDSSGRRSYDVGGESSRVGEARYCPHCEILFLDVTLFHLHMGLHNVNNPWQCNICGLACAGRLEFNTHVLHY